MKCELFSARSSEEEVEIINLKTNALITSLKKHGCSLLYKTEVDLNPENIEKALKNSASSSDPPELIIIANALSTTDRSSFLTLFEQSITNADALSGNETVIRTLNDLGNGYPAYYFIYCGIKVIALPQLFLCGNDIVAISLAALNKIDRYETVPLPTVTEKNRSDTEGEGEGEGESENEAEKKSKKNKKGFWKTVFPQKGDNAGTVISKILVTVFSIVFIVAACLLIDDLVIKPIRQNNKTQSLKGLLYSDKSDTNMTSPYGDEYDEIDLRTKDWDALFEINPDIIGWIRINNTKIDYPVLYSDALDGSDYYYLYRSYDKTSTKYGSIFLDPRSATDLNGNIMVLHGHHMKDGSMFAGLVDYGSYSGNLEAYQNAPIITLENSDGVTKWQIFSVVKTSINVDDSSYFNYCSTQFQSDEEFMEYIYKARVRSLFNVPIPVNEDDRILVLSTCSYEYDNYRTVVFARELRAGEYSKKYTENTTVNQNPLWPDDYYNATGATRVKTTSFKEAYADGQISWYDGKLYQ